MGFYQKHGFITVGRCYFPLSGVVYQGHLMARNLSRSIKFEVHNNANESKCRIPRMSKV
jgi:hypothetical protein